MSIPITDKFKPKGVGGYALIDAEDVEMPDGTRLSEFEGNGTSVTIDTTLSQEGQAADAKAVGDAFTQAASEIEGALEGLAATIPAVDPTLSNEGQAADAKAVGDLFAKATEDINGAMQTLAGAIPTDDHINALIDAKLGVIENGTY